MRLTTVDASGVATTATGLAAGEKPSRAVGWMGGADFCMADDFDAPLEDFEEHMFTDAELVERRAAKAAGKPMPLG